jgi:hypothetical protein
MVDLKTWLEMGYFAGGIVLALVALYGIQQVRILKKDFEVRNERAAKEKAVEYCGRYLTAFIPLQDAFDQACAGKGLGRYDGPIGDFTPDSVPGAYARRLGVFMKMPDTGLAARNELNHIASAFIYGVADEAVGFQVIGRSYCSTVAGIYDLLSWMRSGRSCQYWDPIVKLYQTWSVRLSRTEMEALRASLDARLTGVPDSRIPPIGEDR